MRSDRVLDYQKEYMETLDILWNKNHGLKSFKYFLDTAYLWFQKEMRSRCMPKLVALGSGIPEEILWASGCVPYWILGGSRCAAAWSDDCMPRDADPVNRSIMGFLCEKGGVDYSDALFLIPVNCDSMRKIACMLQENGQKVFPLDVPPKKAGSFALEKWEMQLQGMVEAIEKHLHIRITARRILEAEQEIRLARKMLRRFLTVTERQHQVLSDSARLLVQNSYYYTCDLIEWTGKLEQLIKEIEKNPQYGSAVLSRPKVLLMGSPVYFPNYKVPFLMEDIGLSISENLDVTTLKLYEDPLYVPGTAWREVVLHAAAERFFRADVSSAYVVNETMMAYIRRRIQKGGIDGVVYHILKGQIEYDFELPVCEKMFEDQGIPVFRLETDYQYQDLEQLQIRMEAFSEMLVQKRQWGGRQG